MLERSWCMLEPDPPELRLPDDLRAGDVFGGRDCGWVSQMRPFVRAYSRPGDVVFDPFCGFGTTLLAAALEGREGLGMEIDHARAELARERMRRHGFEPPLAQIMRGSLPQTFIPRRLDLCLTSVPYFGCRWPGRAWAGQFYSTPDFETYLMAMRAVFHAVREALPDDGYCIAMAENVRIGERRLPVAWELARVLDSLFLACDERVLCYPPREGAMQQANAEQTPAEGAPDRAMRNDRSHEYALIYRKRRPSIDIERTRAMLARMREEGFALEVHGSFLAWIEADPPSAARRPSDLDLWVPDDAGHWTQLLQHLRRLGFRLMLWGEAVNADVTLDSLRRHVYLRAERVCGDGATIRIDLGLKP
jgi:DNA methylase